MPPDALILGFDTSAAHCAAALLSGDRILAARHEEMGRGQAERLMPMLEEVLAEAGVTWRGLNRIGVGVGPGNFTGVRIAVSAARGLALALKIPALGVSLLDAVALEGARPALACLGAPRGQVYLQGHGTRAEIAPQLTAVEEIPLDWAEPGLTCLGSGAEAVAARLGAATAPAPYAPASAIARLAAARTPVPGDRPAPLYLRGADAAPPSDPPPEILPE